MTSDSFPNHFDSGIEENIGFLGELGNQDVFTIRARTKHTRRGRFRIFYPERADEITHVGSARETTGADLIVDDRSNNCRTLNTLMADDSPGILFGSGGLRSFARDGGNSGNCSFDL